MDKYPVQMENIRLWLRARRLARDLRIIDQSKADYVVLLPSRASDGQMRLFDDEIHDGYLFDAPPDIPESFLD